MGQELAAHLKLNEATGPVRVLDLAAGSGVWGISLAQSSAQVSVMAVDWPGVIHIQTAAEPIHSRRLRTGWARLDLSIRAPSTRTDRRR